MQFIIHIHRVHHTTKDAQRRVINQLKKINSRKLHQLPEVITGTNSIKSVLIK